MKLIILILGIFFSTNVASMESCSFLCKKSMGLESRHNGLGVKATETNMPPWDNVNGTIYYYVSTGRIVGGLLVCEWVTDPADLSTAPNLRVVSMETISETKEVTCDN